MHATPPDVEDRARHRWPRSVRLRRRRDFSQIQRSGARAGNDAMVVLCRRCRSKESTGRAGLAVSKKVGNAPVRNLVKRRLRHALRVEPALWQGLDLVILVRPPAATLSFAALQEALQDAASRARKTLEKGPRHSGRRPSKKPKPPAKPRKQ